jgi:hypothetical protein
MNWKYRQDMQKNKTNHTRTVKKGRHTTHESKIRRVLKEKMRK